jgi:hypothetical protein
VVNWFDVYDPATNSWSQLPNMPQARDHFHAAVVGGKFYVTGGRALDINATITSTVAFDFSTNTWQTGLAPIPTARGGFAAGVLGTEVVVIGGEGGGNTFATVEAYNTTTNTWRTLAPMPTARHGIQAAECNGGLYVAAGGKTQGGGSPSDVHEVFFLGQPTACEPIGSPPPPQPPPPSTIAEDTFTRTVNGGWGTADTGGAWSVVSGSAGNFSVNGAKGNVVTPSGGGNDQVAHLGSASARDVDVQAAVSFSALPTGANGYFGYLVLRRQANGAHYRVGVWVNASGQVAIRGQTSTHANLFPDAATGLTVAPGEAVTLRVQAEGAGPTTIRAKAWKQGVAEPSGWAVTATNSVSSLQSAGTLGIRTVNTASGSPTLSFDDLVAKLLGP